MTDTPEEPSKFRIHNDPDLRLTESEIEAQQHAQDKVRNRLYKEGVLVDLDEEEAQEKANVDTTEYREVMHGAEDIRAGLNKHIRPPDVDSLESMDPDTRHLVALGEIRPGTEAYLARIQPAEQTIEVIGPKGPEGFGVIKRYDVTGTQELP